MFGSDSRFRFWQCILSTQSDEEPPPSVRVRVLATDKPINQHQGKGNRGQAKDRQRRSFESTSISQTKHSPLLSRGPPVLSSSLRSANTAAILFPRRIISNRTEAMKHVEEASRSNKDKVGIFIGKSNRNPGHLVCIMWTASSEVKLIYVVPLWNRCHPSVLQRRKATEIKVRQTLTWQTRLNLRFLSCFFSTPIVVSFVF